MQRVLTLLGISVLALLAWGFVVLASAGGGNGMRLYSDPNHFIIHQAVWLLVALPFLFAAIRFDYHKWREWPWLTIGFYIVVVALMGAVFLFPRVNGSHRLVVFGPLRLQPSEFAKLLTVFATAVFLDRAGWMVGKFWRGACRAALIVAVPLGLALAEPDYGATMVIALVGGVLFLVSGMKILHMVILGVTAGCVILTFLSFNANRMNRILSWGKGIFGDAVVNATGAAVALSDKEQAAAHQADMALVAIRNGGLTGVGFNKSYQKLRYLPEAHTDFIFAIGAEEWGLIFSLSLLALFVLFLVCGMVISARAPDRLGRLLAFGMTFLVFFQAVFNIGVVTKCLPTKGLALPFISYGGTNLISALIAVGVLFNVGRQIELPKPRPRSTISPGFPKEGV